MAITLKLKTIFMAITLCFCSYFAEAPRPHVIWLPEVVIEAKSYDREVFDTALELGADTTTAKIIVAQAWLESGRYTNRLTINHNNIFSMQHARKRRTTSLGPFASAEKRKNKYASYSDLRGSVQDLFFYFEEFNIKKKQPSIKRYVKTLKSKGFFESSAEKYERDLRTHFRKLKL